MKIYMSIDMEGATGVVNAVQTRNDCPEYAFGCKMQEHDLLAAVEGAFEGGATEVLINDAHSRMINVDVSHLPGKVSMISGTPKPLGMVEGAEGNDAAFFLCYHAMAGTSHAVLDHTVSGRTVYNVRLNGRPAGETALNAAVCARYGMPVALVTGDNAVCSEAASLLGEEVVTCAVKESRGHCVARLLPPERTAELIRKSARDAVLRALEGKSPIMKIEDNYSLEIAYHYTTQCDTASTIPGAVRIDGRTLRFEGTDMAEMRRLAGAAISLGGQVAF